MLTILWRKISIRTAITERVVYLFVDSGNYYFAIGDDCHDALNNVIAARAVEENISISGMTDSFGNNVTGDASKAKAVTLEAIDTHYSKSQYSGNVVSNQVQDANLNYFYEEDVVTYMSRENWDTFPDTYDSVAVTSEMKAQLSNDESYIKPSNAPAYDSFTQGADVTLKFVEMKDVPFEDSKWDTFINQLTIGEMCNMIGENFGQPAVIRVGKPPNVNSDGPSGPQSNYKYGDKIPPTMRVNEIVAASTWNKDIISDRGGFIAEDCLFDGTTQLWSPGANIHRTPFSGRNFEYYSECSIMSYICVATQTKAMQEKGVNAAPKHFAANDQETNRHQLSIFMTEQALRQGPLKGFEGAFTEGGALSTMMSCSRIGCRLMYNNSSVLTDILRNEWNWAGVNITDAVKGSSMPTISCLVSGTDTFNADASRGPEVQKYLVQNKDGNVLQALRAANKRFFFAMSRSNLINGLTPDTEVSAFIPWWQPVLIVIICVIGVAMLVFLALFIFYEYIRKPKNKKEEKSL